jgi:hypothetical protein
MTAPALAPAVRMPPEYLRPLVEQLPGYRAAVDRVEQASAALRALTPPAIPDESGPITEWADAMVEYETATAQYESRRKFILGAQHRASAEAANIFNSNINSLLHDLAERLTRLMADVTGVVAELNGAATAEQAVALDVGPAWKRLRDLAGEYETLRSGQEWLLLHVAPRQYWVSCRPSLGGEDHCNLAYLRNLDDLWPDWRQLGLSSRRINLDGSKDRQEPWPADGGPELLIWLLKSSAQPWIPSLPELDALFRELRERANPDPQPAQAERVVLNRAPRPSRPAADYYDRVAPEIEFAPRDTKTLERQREAPA